MRRRAVVPAVGFTATRTARDRRSIVRGATLQPCSAPVSPRRRPVLVIVVVATAHRYECRPVLVIVIVAAARRYECDVDIAELPD